MTKHVLRRKMLERRRLLTSEQITHASGIITNRLLLWPVLKEAKICMAFLSMADEPQLDGVINELICNGKTVCVPRLHSDFGSMEAAILTSLSEVITGRINLRVPKPECPLVSPEQIDLVLVPGVAFDKSGARIGMGAGYYDRYLSSVPNAVLAGVAWGFQVLEDIPCEPHDVSVRYLVTEDGIYDCMQGKI